MRSIVLIPGIGGSILVNKSKPTRKLLGQEVIHNRWLNVYPFLPKSIDNWKNDMKCVVERDGKYGNVIGVKPVCDNIIAYDVGGTKGIKDILPEFLLLPYNLHDVMQSSFQFRYFHDICEYLYSHGYKDHHSLFGIPYDFRLVLDPQYRGQLFATFKTVIEKATQTANCASVVASHSLGAILFKWFLSTYVDQTWIRNNVHRFFMISPPFGGSLFSLKTVMVGDFYIPQFHSLYKDELQSNTGIIMCLPNKYGFKATQPLMEIEETNMTITLADYQSLYDDGHVSFQIWHDLYIPHVSDIYKYVDVDCHIIDATSKPTPKTYRVKRDGVYPHREYQCDRGDGIILPLEYDIIRHMFPEGKLQKSTLTDCKHTDIISNQFVMRKVLESALNK